MNSASDPRTHSPREILEFKNLHIDLNAHRVICDGSEVTLTKSEFELLVELARNAGNVVSSDQLSQVLSGSNWIGDGHAIEVQISRLRSKLGEWSKEQRFIRTVRSVGYRFDGEPHGPIVTLTYDEKLRVVNVVPKAQPFFGWDPDEIIGTYFVLAAGPIADIPQADAIGVLRAVAATQPQVVHHSYDVRCADGRTQTCNAVTEVLLDADGQFVGAILTVHS